MHREDDGAAAGQRRERLEEDVVRVVDGLVALQDALDLLDEPGPWALACAVAAIATGGLAARLRQPGLWAIAGFQAFLSLCGEKKTQERILFMLENGKPLRN